MNTTELEEIAKKVQSHEATIQSFLGEKSAMRRQLIEEEKELNKLRDELLEKFNLDIDDLSQTVEDLEIQIQKEYQELDEKVKQLE